MTKTTIDTVAPSPALDVQARAADFLVARRDRKAWSDKDEEALQAWLSESMAHRIAFWRLESVWDRADRLNALRPLAQPGKPAVPVVQRKATLFIAAAAAIGVIAIGTSTNLWLSQPSATTYATPVGGRQTVPLEDGSSIELNTNTVLRMKFTNDRRVVELVRGEALFDVKHDSSRPFVVLAANHRVVDLGTKFLVREDGASLKVALIEGSARLEAMDVAKSAVLLPGDEALATARGLSVTRKSSNEMERELGWQRGVLVFQRTTLVEVANEYNRYNHRKIVIGDAKAGARVITATLPTHDVEGFARMARNFLGLSVSERGTEIVISH